VQRAVRRLPGEVPVLSVEPRSLEDIWASVEEVGAATGCVDAAGRVGAAMRRQIAAVAGLDAPLPAPRVACLEWTDPIMVGGHWVPEMVELAGAVDPLGTAGLPGFDLLPCAENGRVVAVDGSAFFNRPGPRITQSIRIIATAVRARNGDAAPEGAAYWNQPATSRTALMTPRPL
jgi:iron complex transport system substrate-binding protein